MQCEKCGFVSLVDETRGAHLETVHSARVACYVCYERCILLGFFNIPLINVHCEWDGQFKDVQSFLFIIDDDNIWLEVGDAQVG